MNGAGNEMGMNMVTGGQHSVANDDEAMALWEMEGAHGIWQPEVWHKSPQQLVEEARAQNIAGYMSSARNAGKHSH